VYDKLTLDAIAILIIGAFGIGFAKSGFAAVSMVHVIAFAYVFSAKQSTGILLPLLIIGDILAVIYFGKHVKWNYVWRLMFPAAIGVGLGTALMDVLDERAFKPLVGTIIFGLTCMQIVRYFKPNFLENVPHAKWFIWTIGILAGVTTMVANAAGPIIAIYFVAVALPKFEFTGTSAWYFLILNTFKVPFSMYLNLISVESVLLDLSLGPIVFLGLLTGRMAVHHIPQKWFNALLLAFTAIASLRLMGIEQFVVFLWTLVREVGSGAT
jgi:uncharacterized protein